MKPAGLLGKGDVLAFALVMALLVSAGAWFASTVPLGADEGTHLTLALFYRDLLSAAPGLGWDPGLMYQFGLSYLVHYPKLTVTYLPFYHLTLAPLMSFSTSVLAGRALSLAYFLLTMLVVYHVGSRHFGGRRTGMISAVLFASLPMAWWGAFRVSMDWAAYLLCFSGIAAYLWAFSRDGPAAERWQRRYGRYSVASVIAFLALMSRIFAVFPIAAMLLHSAMYGGKPRVRRLLALSIPFVLLAVPALFAFNYFGGLDASISVAAEASNAPWSVGGLLAPFFYAWIYPLETFGIGITVLAAAFLSVRKCPENPKYAFLLLWLAVSYVSLTPFQNHRYASFVLMPVVLLAANWFGSLEGTRKLLVPLLLAALLAIPLFSSYSEAVAGSGQRAAELAIASYISGSGGNIGILDENPVFSSVYIWYASASDPGKVRSVYRPCFFGEKDVLERMRSTGITTLIATRGGTNYGLVRNLTAGGPVLVEDAGGSVIEVYEIPGAARSENCNFICLTGGYVCSDRSSPYDLLEK